MAHGGITDRSGTITAGTTAQAAMSENKGRTYLLVQNIDAAEDLWINFGTDAEIDTEGSIQVVAGAALEYFSDFVPTDSVSVNATTTGHKFTAKEG